MKKETSVAADAAAKHIIAATVKKLRMPGIIAQLYRQPVTVRLENRFSAQLSLGRLQDRSHVFETAAPADYAALLRNFPELLAERTRMGGILVELPRRRQSPSRRKSRRKTQRA